MFKDKAQFYKIGYEGRLPANNISQQLYFKQLPNCQYRNELNEPWRQPACCSAFNQIQSYDSLAPVNLWKDVRVQDNKCTDDAFSKQCFLSQYYNYLSHNNTLK